ncbi:WW domain-containing protein [Arthroderma uncinatum]|uniref:WW domain-containing protein n=1 Tax=Arthroderma uncinatum TaxID=74035 RepID=UPI00144A5344|nr:WW domain-containing protein [Arthroderma uncinatum]KAF3481699.1 WW domain-containing protein [Arthroderma uncinatum]
MSSSHNTSKGGDEMFLNSPSNHEPPVISPLRVAKRGTPSPAPSTSSNPQQDRPGTSQASVSPLPYPDDRRMQDQSWHHGNNGSQPNDPREHGRPSFSPISLSSPASSGGEIPAALKPQDRRDPKQVQSSLAERRGAAAPKQLESPTAESPDKEGLFQCLPQRDNAQQPSASTQNKNPAVVVNPYPDYHQQYWPPPSQSASSSSGNLQPPSSSINRIDSTASTSTTKAQRGSPPPPETPIVGPGQQPSSDIEARYAASGIAGTATLSNIHAHNHAAQQRAQQYSGIPGRNNQPGLQQATVPPPRPWTPTEQPGSEPHGPPRIYQGDSDVTPIPVTEGPSGQLPKPPQPNNNINNNNNQSQLDDDFQRLNMTASPPPAYSSVMGGQNMVYPNEKHGGGPTTQYPPIAGSVAASGPPSVTGSQPSIQSHPAFANDSRQTQSGTPGQQSFQSGPSAFPLSSKQSEPSSAHPGPGPASPPPLPEGWIAHLDPNSGQYYYIHLPTQSTQWEFPKGPTPLNLNETPLSPGHSTFGGHGLTSPGLSFGKPLASPALSAFGQPLASPGLSAFGQPMPSPGLPMTPGYEGSVMGMNSGFVGPPPSSGVEMYKVAPTNGVYFGPYLRYTNMDMERGLWLGSILLVTDAAQPPTIHMHKSTDLSPNPRQLQPARIASHQRWVFYKYSIDIQMDDASSNKWTYAITSHLGCTRYEFLVAGRHETAWRVIATSGNDFALNVNANERSRLGGVGYMWKDIMQKHVECGGFHAQLCIGGQINADRLWKEVPSLKQWLAISGKEARKTAPWTAALEEDVTHAYFHYYTSHFDQPHLREAFAQLPHISQVDDHDIFDGFGSYPDHMQFSNMFKNIGRLGIEMYLLFQHHTTLEILRHVVDDSDLFTITGTGWHFIKYLGPAIAVVGPDCRSERNPHQVLAGPTYQGIFPKVATLPPSVQHCIWMVAVPLIYPRLETAEHLAQTVATGKKAVTGAYNMLGRVTSSVAGVVGAKGAVGSGFESVKRAVGKSGLMGGVLSPFGDIDIFDELKDQWTHESKDLERTYLIRTLQGIAHQRSIRMTFLSGAVNCCGAGLVHDPSHPTDHKTMYQIISSAVVNAPPPSYILKLLHGNNKPLYIPINGQRSVTSQISDTKEDMMELFQTDVAGQPREHRKLMGRRNYVAIVGYDPDAVQAAYSSMQSPMHPPGSSASSSFPKLSLAVDFLVQGDGSFGNVVKFGPVIVPSLDLGR